MSRLFLPLRAFETAYSYVGRLAARLGRAMGEYLVDVGLPAAEFAAGEPKVLQRIAEIGGCDVEMLAWNTPRRASDGTDSVFLGHTWPRSSLLRETVRWCPVCAAEDRKNATGNVWPSFAAYGRASWLCSSIRTCIEHGVELAEQRLPRVRLLDVVFAMAAPQAAEPVHRNPSPLEVYLVERLTGNGSTASFPNAMPPWAAAKFSEQFGATIAFGREVGFDTLTEAQLALAGGVGFTAIETAENLRAQLASLVATFKGPSNAGPQAIFGRSFWVWLSKEADNPTYGPVVEVIRDFIVDNLPLLPDAIVLGQKVQPKHMSVVAAAKHYGLHPKTLGNVLVSAGILSARAEVGVVPSIDVSALDQSLRDLKDSLGPKDLQTYLNCPRVQTKLLIEGGYLKPVFETAEAERRYARRMADEFMASICSGGQAVDTPSLGWFNLVAATKRANCKLVETVDLIRSGQLPVQAVKAMPGFMGAHVELEALKKLTRGEPLPGFTKREFIQLLSLSDRVANALIENGIVPTIPARHPVHRGTIDVVPTEAVEAFAQTFVTLHNLAAERGQHFLSVKKDLEQRAVAPAFDPATVFATIYRRCET